jgi:hypothetical protein
MLKTIMICDMCNEEIPTYEKKAFKGIKKRFYKTGKSKCFPHLHIDLCEGCAASIDIEMLEWKISVINGQ